MNQAKKQMSDGCNIVAVILLNVALFSLIFPISGAASALSIAGVAAAAAFIGALIRFQAIFEKWELPNVSFSMKQVGSMRGKRRDRSSK